MYLSASEVAVSIFGFYGGIFSVGASNGAISSLTKFNRYVGENNA